MEITTAITIASLWFVNGIALGAIIVLAADERAKRHSN